MARFRPDYPSSFRRLFDVARRARFGRAPRVSSGRARHTWSGREPSARFAGLSSARLAPVVLAVLAILLFSSCEVVINFVGFDDGGGGGGGDTTSETETSGDTATVSPATDASVVRIFTGRGGSSGTDTVTLNATITDTKEVYAVYYNQANQVTTPRFSAASVSAAGVNGSGSDGTGANGTRGGVGGFTPAAEYLSRGLTASAAGRQAVAEAATREAASYPMAGSPEITASNGEIAREIAGRGPDRPEVTVRGSGILSGSLAENPLGSTDKFWLQDSEGNWGRVDAAVRAFADDESAGRRVRIWVDDSDWHETGSGENLITAEMAEALATRFLAPGESNDIYDWVTAIMGREWGEHGYQNLIDPTGAVDIFVTDIGQDEETAAGIVGYFWAKDNLVFDPEDALAAYSNERVMFTIDAPFLAAAEGESWEITDSSPSTVVSTLAHEFQHMIHFYQRAVLGEQTSSVYFEEMLSMGIEDFVADKIGVNGPRGVSPTDGSAGPSGNTRGRMPWLILYPDSPALTWLPNQADENGDPYVLRSYSLWYGFGSYLYRNYGGASLVPALLDGDGNGDETTILSALSSRGVTTSWEALYLRFMSSLLLSDTTGAPADLRLNQGTWFESTVNDEGYRLGSIDAYRYQVSSYDDGPYVYAQTDEDVPYALPASIAADTAVIEILGRAAAGAYRFTVDLPAGGNYNGTQAVALVLKDAD